MFKKNLKKIIIGSVVILLPMLAGLILWNRLPELLPMHWNAAGEIDGWGSRASAATTASVKACQPKSRWLLAFPASTVSTVFSRKTPCRAQSSRHPSILGGIPKSADNSL